MEIAFLTKAFAICVAFQVQTHARAFRRKNLRPSYSSHHSKRLYCPRPLQTPLQTGCVAEGDLVGEAVKLMGKDRGRSTGFLPPYARTRELLPLFPSIFLFGQSDFQVSKTIFDSREILFLELQLLFWSSCYFLELLLGSSIWWRELGETPSRRKSEITFLWLTQVQIKKSWSPKAWIR